MKKLLLAIVLALGLPAVAYEHIKRTIEQARAEKPTDKILKR